LRGDAVVRTHLTGYERCVPARPAREVSRKGANGGIGVAAWQKMKTLPALAFVP